MCLILSLLWLNDLYTTWMLVVVGNLLGIGGSYQVGLFERLRIRKNGSRITIEIEFDRLVTSCFLPGSLAGFRLCFTGAWAIQIQRSRMNFRQLLVASSCPMQWD